MSLLFFAFSRYIRLPEVVRFISPAPAGASHKRQRTRLYLELLEDRTVPSTLSVANANINEIGNVSAFVAPSSGGLSGPRDLVLGPGGNLSVASQRANIVRG